MTNPIAFVLAGVLALAAIADFGLNGGASLLFLARKLVDLIELVSIWR